MKIMGIDPGYTGALVLLDGNHVTSFVMPVIRTGNDKEVDIERVLKILREQKPDHVFIEKPVSFGMGTKGAFNYGKAFSVLEMSLKFSQTPYTMVEPSKWTKEMHEGINSDLKPKVKSKQALKRLFPFLVPDGVKTHDGIMDATLLAEFGRRKLGQYARN